MTLALHLVATALFAALLPGIVVRTKSWWAGRRGAPVLQLVWDVLRLVRKTPVISTVTTPVFRAAPYVALGTSLAAALLAPFAGAPALSFPGDFVLFAYLWGLGRVALMLGALDTGSPFEGMGASREATFSTLLEPGLFLALGALAIASGEGTLAGLLHHREAGALGVPFVALLLGAFVVLAQVECSRMPVDDPTTHLELTMVHEVMILDHSGPDLAALQASAALKLATCAALIGALVVPQGLPVLADAGARGAIALALAVGLGTIESLTARLRMRAVPAYVLAAVVSGAGAVLVAAWGAR